MVQSGLRGAHQSAEGCIFMPRARASYERAEKIDYAFSKQHRASKTKHGLSPLWYNHINDSDDRARYERAEKVDT